MTYHPGAIMLIGDLHFRDTPPRNAVDTYVDDLFGLLDWTIDYAIGNKIRTIVWAGDIFDHKQPSRTSHALVLRLLERVQRIVTEQIELRIVIGNHDISNDVVESAFTKQPLGVLLAAGAKELNGWHPSLPLYGVPWQQRWHAEGVLEEVMSAWQDTTGLAGGYRADPQWSHANALMVTHASIFPDHLHREIMYEAFAASQVAAAMGGIGNLYHGHIHDDHGTYTEGGVSICNPGALSRGSANESNMTRTIHLAIWEPHSDPEADEGPAQFITVDIPAKSAEETFRIESVREAKSNRLTLERFLSGLGSTVLDITDRHGVINYIQERTDIAPHVRERAIQLLEDQDA